MSGVQRKALAETKGLRVPTNEELKMEALGTKKELSEKYGQELHKEEKKQSLKKK